MPILRSAIVFAAAVFAACTASLALAGPLVRVDVVDRDSGQWLSQHRHRGDTWIAGQPGRRYVVRLTNTSAERVLVVLSVDGVNAVTGQTADPSQAGYVLAPWQTTEIAGWRKSLDGIAQFVFTDLPDSYAARTGRPDHVGVIGVAAFRERRIHPPRPYPAPPPIARESRSADAPASAAAESAVADQAHGQAARQRIGTGHGQHEWSPVEQTSFVRASSRPAQLTQLRYDAPARLAALGIPVHRHPHYAVEPRPRAFPGGFVPDPY